jgi:hypothetical protein
MKLMRNVTLTIIAALVALPVLGGCKAEPREELTPARKACIEMMQKVPVDYEDFQFWDAKTLQSDVDLGEIYKVWYERKIEYLEQEYGIQSTRVNYLADAETLNIIQIDYYAESLRAILAEDFYRDTGYPEIEVWKSEQNFSGSWVLAEGLLVRLANPNDIDNYLRVRSGEELSLYDKNAAALLERLPEGITTRISRSSYPEGLIITGMSVEKEEKNVLRWTNIYKFESEADVKSEVADKYFKEIENGFKEAESSFAERGEASPFNTFSIKYDGEFVTWSVLIDEKYMIALLFYG